VGEVLLTPTRIYVRSVLAVRDRFAADAVIRGAAHITGGGITENVPRVLPDGLGAVVRLGSWPVPPVFRVIQGEESASRISDEEMYRVFNMGIGLVLIVDREAAQDVSAALAGMGEQVYEIGEVQSGQGVTYIGE
jgi:phosphoribosylformylglycinamidine cyclo-ligase